MKMERFIKKKKNNLIFSKIKFFIPYLFVFLLPTQLGRHFFFSFSYLNGLRVDYLAPTIYLIDIVFILMIFFNLNLFFSFLKEKKIIFFFLILSLNLFFSQLKPITFYSILKVFQFLFVFYFFYKTKIDYFFVLISFLSITIIELFLALYQLNFGKSFDGIFYFLGERHFNLSTPGIAKISFFGKEILRPYGTFSHPNSLAGFYLLFYTFILSTKNFSQFFLLKNLCLFLSSFLIFFSFSKVAIFAFLMVNFFYFLKIKKDCLLCFFAKVVSFFILSLIFFIPAGDRLSFLKRIELLNQSLKIIVKSPFFGVGLGAYVYSQSKFVSFYPLFFNQPVHNIFLLLASEIGLPFFLGLAFFLFNFFKKNYKKKSNTFYYLIIAIFFTGFFDHYWLTLKQNFLVLAFIFAETLKRS